MGSILFWSYDPSVPSFRHRLAYLVPGLEARGWRCRVESPPRGRYLLRLLERRRELGEAALVVLAKVRLGIGEGRLLRRLARRVAFDVDDAMFVRQPRRSGEPPDASSLRRRKFAATCRASDLVIAGNGFLADAARPWAKRVEVVPTPVDLDAYPVLPPEGRRGRTVAWIGRPENLVYLAPLRPVFADLAGRFPDFRLRVICSEFPDWPEVPVERVLWAEEREGSDVATAGVGIMPLSDDDWSRGKCAFKLLQYMAAGLPTVASAVGENREVTVEGETGYLVRGAEEWAERLAALLAAPELRARLGAAGRERVRRLYDRRVVAPRAVDVLAELAAAAVAKGRGA